MALPAFLAVDALIEVAHHPDSAQVHVHLGGHEDGLAAHDRVRVNLHLG